jgi:hypothetical protein
LQTVVLLAPSHVSDVLANRFYSCKKIQGLGLGFKIG